MPRELSAAVERADLDPAVHVIALAGNGKGFCGGYDLVASAERRMEGVSDTGAPKGSPLDPLVQLRNHDPAGTWDPTIDYAMMSQNVRGFMSLFHANKPVVWRSTASAWRAAPTWRCARTSWSSRRTPGSATRRRGCGACPPPRCGRT